MKKLLVIVLSIILVLNMSISALAVGLGDNPPKPSTEPKILSATLASSAHTTGNIGSVSMTVETVNIANGTTVTAQLMDQSGNNPITGVSLTSSTISTNKVVLNLSIPAGIEAGSYKIKVHIPSLDIFSVDTVYTIRQGAHPAITSVSASSVSHISGNQNEVIITITTLNASNNTPVMIGLVDDNNEPVTGVSASGIINNNSAKINLIIPSDIIAGSYKISVTLLTITDRSASYTVQPQTNSPAIASVAINPSSHQSGSLQSVTVIIATQLVDNGTPVTVSLMHLNGEAVNLVNSVIGSISNNLVELTLYIPGNVPSGSYWIQTIVDQIPDSNLTAYTILTAAPAISQISTTGANLIAGSISGNIVISGVNFSSVPSQNQVAIVRQDGTMVQTATISSTTTNSLTISIPTSLAAGTYKVKVMVNELNVISHASFSILPASTTPPTSTNPPASGQIPPTTDSPITGPIVDEGAEEDSEPIQLDLGAVLITTNDAGKVFVEVLLDSNTLMDSFLEDGSTVMLDIALVNEAEDVSVSLPSQIFNTASDYKKTLAIAINNVLFTIIPGSIDPSNSQNIMLSIKKSSNSSTPDAYQTASMIYEFNLTFMHEGKESKLEFLNPIDIELTYDSENVTHPEKLGVYYFNVALNQWQYVGGRVNQKNKRIVFTADHFSHYTVMAYNKTFMDTDYHWAKDEIEVLAARHIAKGSGTNYMPNNAISRAEFSTLLIRALNLKMGDKQVTFKDVTGDWYQNPIEVAASHGIVNGYEGMFDPHGMITREQMATMVVRALEVIRPDDRFESQGMSFDDVDALSSWALDAAAIASDKGLIRGIDNSFKPRENATRAQTAVIIYRLLQLLGEI